MANKKSILVPHSYYHVYNQAIGNDKLFIIEENYFYFLGLCKKYILPVAEIFSFCLVPNHFEFFICFRKENTIWQHMKKLNSTLLNWNYPFHLFLLQQFSNFFNAYAKALNKQQNRNGRLFLEPFSRISLTAPLYFTNLIVDMHSLPVQMGLCQKVGDWPFNSYTSIKQGDAKWLQSEKVMDWFQSIEQFNQKHEIVTNALIYKKPIEILKSRSCKSMRSGLIYQ